MIPVHPNHVFQAPVRRPCPGLMMRRTENGYPVIRLHYSADPEKDEAWVSREKPKFSPAYWDQEFEINAHARSGQLVYPEFDPSIHVIPADRIPSRMCRWMAIDPHPRTPHAFLWVGIDQWSDWYVYREMWPSKVYGKPVNLKDDEEDFNPPIRDYAETVAYLEGNRIEWKREQTDRERGKYIMGNLFNRRSERIIARYMDQAGKGFKASAEGTEEEFYSSRYERFGLSCLDPIKSHKSGEDAIRMLLKPRRHDVYGDWPRLHISASCPELQLELRRYRYKVTRRFSDERELKQEGVEARCHLIDLLRYLATARLSYIERLAS